MLRRIWLVFAQACTVCLAVLFVVTTLRPDLLARPGDKAGRDVPIAIVAHDPAVLNRISGWGWQEGLKPGPKAPVWRMDTFRDRFLTAYGPKPAPSPSPSRSRR